MLSLRFRSLLLPLVLLSAAGCAARHPRTADLHRGLPGRDACVQILYIQNWDLIAPDSLIVYAPERSDAFLVNLEQPVPDLNAHDNVGFTAGNHDGQICGVAGDMLVRASLHVPVAAVRSLSGKEVKRLKPPKPKGSGTPPAAAAPTPPTPPASPTSPAAGGR
jgi:hypothetical protein